MSFTLIDRGSENFEIRASVWSWKAALEIIKSFDVLSEGTIRQMSYNATGFDVSRDDALMIGEKLRDNVLPKLEPGQRMFGDMSVTEAPDDGTIHKDADDKWKNYSVDHEWLSEFTDFCLKCKGFQIF
ncbi:MAG: hypothetical protein HKN33_07630 [Pyrinomonadaceae bacterium]|nr:hypothetical protein [Pyrinomonadaceae bacterium]